MTTEGLKYVESAGGYLDSRGLLWQKKGDKFVLSFGPYDDVPDLRYEIGDVVIRGVRAVEYGVTVYHGPIVFTLEDAVAWVHKRLDERDKAIAAVHHDLDLRERRDEEERVCGGIFDNSVIVSEIKMETKKEEAWWKAELPWRAGDRVGANGEVRIRTGDGEQGSMVVWVNADNAPAPGKLGVAKLICDAVNSYRPPEEQPTEPWLIKPPKNREAECRRCGAVVGYTTLMVKTDPDGDQPHVTCPACKGWVIVKE